MLDALFRPRSVAVIGASNNPLSIGHIVMQNLIAHNFQGPIFPINPKASQIKCFKAYKSVLEIPDEVDLVNISIKNTYVPMALEECGKKGVKFAIVHTAGFKEVGEEGAALERQIVEIAHKYGMRVYGPNSQGIQNSDPEVSVYANFTFVPMFPGNVSILAQSGGVGEVLKLHMYKIGMGIRMYASYGNECDVSMTDILRYYGDDPGTKVIMLHIETLKDPRGFLEVAGEISKRKPVLALKSGRTREGLVAVSSHTGTLMEADTTTDVIFRKAGVLRFDTQEEMIDAAIAFSSQPAAPGKRMAIVTNTGGPGILALDECMQAGLELAQLEESTKSYLRENLHPEATVKNPVDVIATAGPDHYHLTVEALLKDPNVDAIVINFISAPFVDTNGVARRIAEAAEGSDKPVVCCIMTIPEWGELIDIIRQGGVPVFEFPETAGRVMVAMSKYGGEIRPRETGEPETFEADKAGAEAIIGAAAAAGAGAAAEGEGGYLSQAEAYKLLGCYGITTAGCASAAGKDELAAAAGGLSFPVALKIDEPDVVHKTEAGGVVLGIEDQARLLAEYETLAGRVGKESPRVLIQEMLAGGREVIIGATANEGITPTVMFGLGGIFVEVMKDVQFRLTPLTRAEAGEMIRALKGFPILQGTRGQEGVDLDQLTELLLRVSQLVTDFPAIREMDLNPVFAFPRGQETAVVDVRIRV